MRREKYRKTTHVDPSFHQVIFGIIQSMVCKYGVYLYGMTKRMDGVGGKPPKAVNNLSILLMLFLNATQEFLFTETEINITRYRLKI